MEWFLAKFIILWAVIDPVGTVPVFISVTDRMSASEKRRVAFIASSVAFGILLFFVVVGELLLRGMGVPLTAFQISGGIVLFLFALTMIFGESKPDEEVKLAKKVEDTAVFPLATPSLASPGAMMAAVLLTENNQASLAEQLAIVGVISLVILISLGCMLFSGAIGSLIGRGGASVISRVMGLILASVAATNVRTGRDQELLYGHGLIGPPRSGPRPRLALANSHPACSRPPMTAKLFFLGVLLLSSSACVVETTVRDETGQIIYEGPEVVTPWESEEERMEKLREKEMGDEGVRDGKNGVSR